MRFYENGREGKGKVFAAPGLRLFWRRGTSKPSSNLSPPEQTRMPGTLSRRALPTIMNWAFALELLYFLVSPHQSNTNVWFHWFSWEESTDCKQSPLKTSTHMQLIPRTSDFFQAIENFPEFSFTEKVSKHGYPYVLLALWCPCIIGDSGVNIFNGNLKRIVLQGGGAPKVKVWSTYFLPNMLRNLDINMASTAHDGVTKVLFRTTCDMCRFSFDLNYRGHLKECYYFQ